MTEPPIIVGVDPGGTTGFSIWNDTGVVLAEFHQEEPKRAVGYIWQLIDGFGLRRNIHIACERYDITPQTARMTRQYDALHVAGALKFKCELMNERTNTDIRFIQYGRSDAKRFADDARLKAIGWWVSGRDHVNDATRQVVMHIATVQPVVLKQLLTRR